MSSPIDTEEWGLSAYMDWKPSKSYVTCECCGGKGIAGGGFKDMEGPQDCDRCNGTGRHGFYPKSAKPEIPKELIEHMRSAWIAYWGSTDTAYRAADGCCHKTVTKRCEDCPYLQTKD